jgi:hypothetical protein
MPRQVERIHRWLQRLLAPEPLQLHDQGLRRLVYGFSETGPQEWMAPLAYLALMMVVLPIGIFLPTHWGLTKLFGRRRLPLPSPNGPGKTAILEDLKDLLPARRRF